MTNGVKSSTISSTYAKTVAKQTGTKDAVGKQDGKQTLEGKTKLENIKSQIENGEYKIDIDRLAKKMAEELLL